MDTLIQGGKYQVIEVLEAENGYKACLCIDVETNNHYKPMLFNIYENDEDIRRLLPEFYDLGQKKYSGFIRVMSGQHSIMAVFEHNSGVRFTDYFQRLNKDNFELRCKYASLLLEECLVLDAAPEFMAYACLEAENLVVSEKLEKVKINYILRPWGYKYKGFKGEKLARLLELVFVRNRYVPDGLWEYIEDLKCNEGLNVVAAFSGWKEIKDSLLEEHKQLRKEAFPAYLLRRLKKLLKKKIIRDRF